VRVAPGGGLMGAALGLGLSVLGYIAEGYLSLNTKVGDEMRRYGMRGRKQ
jgi:hypothetical protein